MSMKYEEYKAAVKELEKELDIKKRALVKSYVDANNPYNIGDIVTDVTGSIRIESVRYFGEFMGSAPCAIYYGVELRKDGQPKKSGEKRTIYQSNLLNQTK